METNNGTNSPRTETERLPKTFKRRPGTVSQGHHYENKMVALLSLRCAANRTEETWIATNADGLGAFDDVFIFKQSPNGPSACCIQLKHKNRPLPIRNCEFIGGKKCKKCECKSKNFLVAKYEQSFTEINKMMESSSGDELTVMRLLRQSFIQIYILLTNREIGEFDLLNKITDDKLGWLNLVNTRGNLDNVYQLNGSMSSNRSWADNFFLLSNQLNVNQLNDIIQAEMRKFTAPVSLTERKLQEVAEKFIHFISTWSDINDNCLQFLTNLEVTNEVMYILLTPHIFDLSKQACSYYHPLQYALWNKIILDQQSSIIIVDYSEPVCKFLTQLLSYEILTYYHRPVKIWGDRLCPDVLNSLFAQQQDLREVVNGTLESMTLIDLYKSLWLCNKLPLLVQVDSVETYKEVVQISKLSTSKLKIIIINKSTESLSASNDVATTLQVQDKNLAEELLNRPVVMQGKSSILLQELMNDDMLKHMNFNDVIYLLCESLRIGNDLQPLEEYVMERNVSSVFLAREVLKTVPEELFLIHCRGHIDFESLDLPPKVCYPNEIYNINLNNYQVIFFENTRDLEQLFKALPEDKIIHHLILHGCNDLKWCKSRGTIKNIQSYRLPTKNNDFLPLATFDNKLNIVSAGPGMGKTVLIDYLAVKVPPNAWVLKIDLYAHREYYKSEKCRNPSTSASQHLFCFYEKTMKNSSNNTKLTRDIFTKCMDERRIVVLLDGFDEVSYLYKMEVTNVIKALQKEGFQTWITTRPHMESYLAKELDSFPLFLKPFSVDEQRTFLKQYFHTSTNDLIRTPMRRIEVFVDQLLEAAKNNLSKRDTEFTGIPLQTKLLADFFTDHYRGYISNNCEVTLEKHFDLLSLYRNFVKTKIGLLYDRRGEEAETTKMYETHHSLLAMNFIFPESGFQAAVDEIYNGNDLEVEIIQRAGLITFKDSNVSFVHKTYAEYLAGEWLSENFKNDGPLLKATTIVLKKRFEWEYGFVFNIFDRMMAQNCPLHLSLINGSLELTRELLVNSPNLIYSCDDFGRSLLHIAGIYGTYCPYQIFSEHLIRLNYFKIPNMVDQIINYDINSNLVDGLGYTAIDYAIASGSFAIADQMCAISSSLNVHVKISLDTKHEYFSYCGIFGYENLFKYFVKYFAHQDLLNIDADCSSEEEYSSEEEDQDEKEINLICKDQSRMETVAVIPDQYLYAYCMDDCDELETGKINIIKNSLHSLVNAFRGASISEFFTRFNDKYFIDLHLAAAYGSEENVRSIIPLDSSINKQDVYLRTPLHYAVIFGSYGAVAALVEHGANVNVQCEYGYTPLHWAVLKSRKDIVAYLLGKQANLNLTNITKQTAGELALKLEDKRIINLFPTIKSDAEIPSEAFDTSYHQRINIDDRIITILIDYWNIRLAESANTVENSENIEKTISLHSAVMSGNVGIMKSIIEKGCDVNARNYSSETALHWAVFMENKEIVEFLLENEADVSLSDRYGYTPLFYAVDSDLEEITSQLLKSDKTNNNNGFLHIDSLKAAIKNGNSNIVRMFVSHDMGVSAKHFNRFLNIAAERGFVEIVRLLITIRPNDEDTIQGLNEALLSAIQNEHIEAAQLLVEQGADFNALDGNKNSVLHCAALSASKEIMLWVLHHKTDVNAQNVEGETPLFLAARKNNPGVALLLLQHGADAKILDFNLNSVLHTAAECGSTEVAPLLLPEVNINQQNNDGETPLHVAVKEDQLEFVKFLSIYTPATDINDSNGHSVLHCALHFGRFDIFCELLRIYKNVDLNQQSVSMGHTVLHMAVSSGHKETIDLLLKRKADVNICDNYGNSVLHYSVFAKTEVASLLLDAGADIDKRNCDGATPLHLAAQAASLSITKLLIEKGADVGVIDNIGKTPLNLLIYTVTKSYDTKNYEYIKNGIDIACLITEHTVDVQSLSDIIAVLSDR